MTRSIQEFLAEQMVVIDQMLAQQKRAVRHRPLEAACIFATECIVEIDGISKDEILEHPWFGDVVRWTESWYVERYGAENLRHHDGKSGAIVLILDTPFLVSIPTERSLPGPTPGTVALEFPVSVVESERPLEWLESPPSLTGLAEEALGTLARDVSAVATMTRGVHNGLSIASLGPPARQLAGSIPSHLERAVHDVISLEPQRMSLAIWDLFLAVEKTMKVVLRASGSAVPATHDLLSLVDLLEAERIPRPLPEVLSDIPSAREAIQHRYGEAPPLGIHATIRVYRAALQTCYDLIKHLPTNSLFKDGKVFIRKFPWAR